jgi:hypothetical protein
MNKYHKDTLKKVNKLYQKIYQRSLCAAELSDTGDEALTYMRLSNSLAEALLQFKHDVIQFEK